MLSSNIFDVVEVSLQCNYSKHLLVFSYLRIDTLAIMLSNSNVHAGSRVVVVDGVQGLLLAAAMERMGGRGNIVHIHPGPQPIMYVNTALSS